MGQSFANLAKMNNLATEDRIWDAIPNLQWLLKLKAQPPFYWVCSILQQIKADAPLAWFVFSSCFDSAPLALGH